MLNLQQLKKVYSNEQVTLILLARLHFNTASKAEVDSFVADNKINWALVYKTARVHGLRPFIYYVIKTYQIKTIETFESQLQKSYDKTRRQCLRMTITTSKLVADLKERGVSAIPYKGPVFAHAYYPDVALRESSDIDFLVDEKDIDTIEDYFKEKKYTPKTTVPKRYLKYYKKHFKDMVYRTPDGQESFSVEMHWRLMEKFSGNFPGHSFFLPHVVPYNLGAMPVYKLSPTYDLLIVISNHFVKDMGIKFKYLVDVASLINKEGDNIDHQLINATAAKYGFIKRMEMGLALTENLLGVHIPGTEKNKTGYEGYLPVPLIYPVKLTRLYINEPAFIKHALQLQDNSFRKLKFILTSIKYMFLPTYEDINRVKWKGYYLPLLTITRPFRLLYGAVIKTKK